ncbi:hypothetical protein FOZ62_016716 [Perkinsus olseni]|uniref:Uncharacterized protein n=1 Tax=Perkinsus olseni TaxID=32597 RepID=A0A7J6UEN5_PEROL|nr:hypothetical protein FOZ62_016716 [Perkinsus olseni]
MLLHFLAERTSDDSAVVVNLVNALKLRAPELDNASYPIALTSLAKIPSSEEARGSVLGQLSQVIPAMTGAQLAQTYEGLQEMGAIDEDNAERILTSFLSITSGLVARDWTRLMVAVARARPQDLPHLLECAHSLISHTQWGSARELVEVLHSMAISSYKDPVILRALSKRLRSSILAERSSSHRLQLATSAISYMSAIRTMITTMEELLNDVEQLLRTEAATTIQIHQILSALVRQDDRLISRPSRSGYRELVQLCEDQWCRATATTDLTERAFLSTMALFAEVSRDAFSERLVQLILSWSMETDRVARLNNLDSIQLSGLLARICGSNDSHGAEVVGKAADMIDAVYDHACHELNLREWKPSEFSIFVSRLAAAGDAGLYDAEGLSHTISLHVQRHGHEYDCRHLTLVTEALSKLSSRVQEANALGPLWHEISSRLAVFQAKQLLTIGIAMPKFTRDTVTAIQYRNFPSLTGAFLKDGTLLASLDTCSRVSLISAWSRVGALTGSLLEAVASGITDSASFKHPIRDASRILFSLYCINLHSLMRNAGPSTQALVRHCRESLEAEAPFAPSVAPEDLVRVLISICASSVISSPTTASRADLVARSALEALAKFHYKWLMDFLGEGGPSRSMFTMAAAWLAEGGFSGDSLGMMDEGTKSRLADLLAELNVPERATPIDLPVQGHYGSDALTMQEQSIYRRLGVNAVAMVPTPPFTVRLATRQGVAIEVLGEREVLGQREDLVAWTRIR